ncbi:MAG: type II toxin-antitoxin system death-on-curing family toxin [Acidimicrobiales bacterium]
MTERLSAEQVTEYNQVLCADTGENSALLDPDGLDAAVERPWSGFGGFEAFPTLYEKAAALLHGIASRQVFENGNKRTAWAAAVALLDINGIDIGHVETVQSDMFVRAAALDHSLQIADLAEWFSVAHQQAKLAPEDTASSGGSPVSVGAEGSETAPLVLVQSSGEAAFAKAFPDGNSGPETPLGAAILWWQGLADPVEYRPALATLSYDPSVWGDYSEAAEAIADRSVTTIVEPCPDDENIRYVKFIEYAGDEAAIVLEAAPVNDLYVVTLVKPPGSDLWLVWGLSHNHFPTAAYVHGD